MDKNKLKEFVGDIFDDLAGAMTAGLAFVGVRTGLFRAMQGQGMMTLEQVVNASELQPRYVEEWLKGMFCAGYLEYDADKDTYQLPDEHAYLLASDDTDHFAGGLFSMAPVLLKVAPQVAEAFKHGGGVPFSALGDEGVTALDMVNRGNYEHKLVSSWLQTMPDVVERLRNGGRGLDVGCGTGHVSLVLASEFSNSEFVGVDVDQESISRADQRATERGLSNRVEFHAMPLQDLEVGDQRFDLVTACDCVHDFSDPIGMLAAMRDRLAADGTLLVIEPKASDNLIENKNSVGTMFYGFSVFHCMTQSLANHGPGLGTCMGPKKTEALMREAGFTKFEVLAIKSQVNLFYAVRL